MLFPLWGMLFITGTALFPHYCNILFVVCITYHANNCKQNLFNWKVHTMTIFRWHGWPLSVVALDGYRHPGRPWIRRHCYCYKCGWRKQQQGGVSIRNMMNYRILVYNLRVHIWQVKNISYLYLVLELHKSYCFKYFDKSKNL